MHYSKAQSWSVGRPTNKSEYVKQISIPENHIQFDPNFFHYLPIAWGLGRCHTSFTCWYWLLLQIGMLLYDFRMPLMPHPNGVIVNDAASDPPPAFSLLDQACYTMTPSLALLIANCGVSLPPYSPLPLVLPVFFTCRTPVTQLLPSLFNTSASKARLSEVVASTKTVNWSLSSSSLLLSGHLFIE